ncbi:SpoIIE family protein phosphatase [Streptomyces sp. NPDC059679]|uniref:ATP-binding SpoIIE family protein phosphatase n=1 Tax=Streptomyces sp. NPDC059679 TaxID=3346903 RepID=UPI00367AB14A
MTVPPSSSAAIARSFPLRGSPAEARTIAPRPAGTFPHHDVAEGPGSGGDDGGWLVAVGEPAIGRLAVLARRRLALLCDIGVSVGTTLDVRRTAEELVKVAVPEFADFCAVDLAEGVPEGEAPGPGTTPVLRRTASSDALGHGLWYPVGDTVVYAPATPQARCLAGGRAVHEPMLSEAHGWRTQDPERCAALLDQGARSLVAAPLRARDTVLGVVTFVRTDQSPAFEDDDMTLAEELVGRAALCIDNARRYTREHATALALQRSLLPRGLPRQNAVDAAYRYLPARSGVGGDWYDVIPLSGCRVALVVGDVTGHGVHAAATMGRLRTAVHNFAALDLPIEDLLTGLDDLACRLDDEEGHERVIGASCLYAVYDPVTRRCTMARAGHPEPALVSPDGSVRFLRLPPGPPLGLGGIPFETTEIELAAGSRLVFFTDGLVERRGRDLDDGLKLLRHALLGSGSGSSPEETCDAVLEALLSGRLDDDVAVLVADLQGLDSQQVAVWGVPSAPSQVSAVRDAITRRLCDWDLEELAFSTELIVSELVTNAIRYGCEPVQVRLLRDEGLVCEVSDGSSTSPRMRRARHTDEGGRGLFLVAQLCHRWGTRYTDVGKVIWTEQSIPVG